MAAMGDLLIDTLLYQHGRNCSCNVTFSGIIQDSACNAMQDNTIIGIGYLPEHAQQLSHQTRLNTLCPSKAAVVAMWLLMAAHLSLSAIRHYHDIHSAHSQQSGNRHDNCTTVSIRFLQGRDLVQQHTLQLLSICIGTYVEPPNSKNKVYSNT